MWTEWQTLLKTLPSLAVVINQDIYMIYAKFLLKYIGWRIQHIPQGGGATLWGELAFLVLRSPGSAVINLFFAIHARSVAIWLMLNWSLLWFVTERKDGCGKCTFCRGQRTWSRWVYYPYFSMKLHYYISSNQRDSYILFFTDVKQTSAVDCMWTDKLDSSVLSVLKLFSQNFGEFAKFSQNMSCG